MNEYESKIFISEYVYMLACKVYQDGKAANGCLSLAKLMCCCYENEKPCLAMCVVAFLEYCSILNISLL